MRSGVCAANKINYSVKNLLQNLVPLNEYTRRKGGRKEDTTYLFSASFCVGSSCAMLSLGHNENVLIPTHVTSVTEAHLSAKNGNGDVSTLNSLEQHRTRKQICH